MFHPFTTKAQDLECSQITLFCDIDPLRSGVNVDTCPQMIVRSSEPHCHAAGPRYCLAAHALLLTPFHGGLLPLSVSGSFFVSSAAVQGTALPPVSAASSQLSGPAPDSLWSQLLMHGQTSVPRRHPLSLSFPNLSLPHDFPKYLGAGSEEISCFSTRLVKKVLKADSQQAGV